MNGAREQGTFGFALPPSWSMTADSVVVSRRWWPLALALAVPLGVWMISGALDRGDGRSVVFAVMLVGLGLGGAGTSAVRPGSRIEATRAGITNGRITFPADDVASVSVQETVQVSRQGIESRQYVLLVCSKTRMQEIRMAIGARRPPMDGDRVCTAMMALVRPPA